MTETRREKGSSKNAKSTVVRGLVPWSGMPVFLAPLASLIPYVRNSKEHPKSQIANLCASLIEFGWTRPVLINSRQDLGIRAGHGTVLAAARLWEDGRTIVSAFDGREIPARMVPCVAAEHLTDTQLRAYVIADNKLAEAPWNNEMLALEMEDLKGLNFDLELTGFSLPELDDLLVPPQPPASFPDVNESIRTEHQCPSCGFKWSGSIAPNPK